MLDAALSAYTRILLEFLAELYVYYFLVTLKLNRGRLFAVRLFGGLAAVVAVAFGLSFFYVYAGQTVWGRIIVYALLFVLTTGHVRLCFDESYKTVLFCCSMAYALQNLTYKLFLFFWTLGEAFDLFENWGNNFELYYRLIYYSFYAAVIAAAYFLCVRRTTGLLADRQLNYRTLVISMIVLGVTVILCSFEDVYFAKLSVGRENRFGCVEHFVLRQTGNAFSVACCIVVLFLIRITMEERGLKREVEYLQHAVNQSERQYEISKSTIDLINIKCHDIKYKVNSLLNGGGEVPKELIDDLQSSISIYDAKVDTGNKLLDVLLTEKSLYCEKNGINFSCMADGARLSFLSDGDLYCLFGNIIDNALEAVSRIEEKERRVINLVVKVKNDMLIVQQDNFYDGNLQFSDGLPVTTKSDKDYHGFGMRSIRMIVHKYDGEFTTYVKGDVFHLNVIFGLND